MSDIEFVGKTVSASALYISLKSLFVLYMTTWPSDKSFQHLEQQTKNQSNVHSDNEKFLKTDMLILSFFTELTLSRQGGHFVLFHLYHSIYLKRLGVWSCCFVTFLSMYFSFRKVQFHQSVLMDVAMATVQFSTYF